MVHQISRINLSFEPIFASYDNQFLKFQHEFIANTNYEIQIWIIKTCCKLYIHKMRKHKILKSSKLNLKKNLNLKIEYLVKNIKH
jgi:hypothetical protein